MTVRKGSSDGSSRSGRRLRRVGKVVGIVALVFVALLVVSASINLVLTRQEKSRFASLRPAGVGRRWIAERLAERARRSDHGAAQRARHSRTRARLRPLDQAARGLRRHRRRGVRLRLQRHDRPPRTVQNITAELHDALAKLDAPKPYILVGHSIAGFYHPLLRASVPGRGLRGRRHRPDRAGVGGGVGRDERHAPRRGGGGPEDERPGPRRRHACPGPGRTRGRRLHGGGAGAHPRHAIWNYGNAAVADETDRMGSNAAALRGSRLPRPTCRCSSSSPRTAWRRSRTGWGSTRTGCATSGGTRSSCSTAGTTCTGRSPRRWPTRSPPSSTPIWRALETQTAMSEEAAETGTLQASVAAEVSFVTTEHFALQAARSATIAESTGRANVFLGAVSGGLVALGLIAGATGVGAAFTAFGLVLLPTLSFLGLVTFERVLQSGIEDHFYGRRIAQLRSYYFDRSPGLARYMFSVPPEGRLQMQGLPVAPIARSPDRRGHGRRDHLGARRFGCRLACGRSLAPFSGLRSCVRRAGRGRDPCGVDARTAPDLDSGQGGGHVRGGGAGRSDARALARACRHQWAELEVRLRRRRASAWV